jgi:miniconductance mechanosensitive channel
VPVYSLISDAFINWRGMSESGGRRIKRAIHIDMTSIAFLDETQLKKFENMRLLKDYIATKKNELDVHHERTGIDPDDPLNSRRLTNLGTFRAYVAAYLNDHPKINKEMTFLVRQLPPTDKGLPLEIYVFSADQRWAHYEGIQADIFDHLLAIIDEFDLRVFQSPGSHDLEQFSGLVSIERKGPRDDGTT